MQSPQNLAAGLINGEDEDVASIKTNEVTVDKEEKEQNESKVDSDGESQAGNQVHGEEINNEIDSPPKKGFHYWSWRTIKVIAGQWFIISLGLVILLASQVQVAASHQELKSTVVSYLAVSLIFFLTGLTLPTRMLLENYTRWKLHLFVQLQCYFMTSAVIFAIISLCALNKNFMDGGLLLGLLLSGVTPTTIASNVIMTEQAGGNKSLTVVQSTLGNFLAPFLTPLIFRMYLSGNPWYASVLPTEAGGYGAIYKRVFKQLGLSLFLPMVSPRPQGDPYVDLAQFVGQLIQNVFPKQTKRWVVDKKISKLSPLCLIIIVWQIYDGAFRSEVFTAVKTSNIIFIVFISVALFFVFNGIAFLSSIVWLSKEDTISVCYCVPAKSPAMGVPLAMTMFIGLTPALQAKLQLPMVIYQALQIVGGTVLVRVFGRWIGKGRKPVGDEERFGQTEAVKSPIIKEKIGGL
jgi:sodium/bile acid cotransporter 7